MIGNDLEIGGYISKRVPKIADSYICTTCPLDIDQTLVRMSVSLKVLSRKHLHDTQEAVEFV